MAERKSKPTSKEKPRSYLEWEAVEGGRGVGHLIVRQGQHRYPASEVMRDDELFAAFPEVVNGGSVPLTQISKRVFEFDRAGKRIAIWLEPNPRFIADHCFLTPRPEKKKVELKITRKRGEN